MSTNPARGRLAVIALTLITIACSGKGGGTQESTVTVPDVVGMTETSAVASLASAGLVAGARSQASSATTPAGSVVSQHPAAGATAARSSAVDLVVSTGPAIVTVPDLAGMTEASARAALSAAGLVAGSVSQAASDTVAAGSVLRQVPAAGASVPSGSAVDLVVSSGPTPLPPDPATIATALDPRGTTPFAEAVGFLTAGPDPIQRGVVPGSLQPLNVAALRGRAVDRGGAPISGVVVDVLGHAELGHTLTRADGLFDLLVNGGGPVTLRFVKDGLLPAQRQVAPDWRSYHSVPDVVLVALDPRATPVDFGGGTMQVVQGSATTDTDGTRQATLLFAPGTTAVLEDPSGATVPISHLTVRATEFTVGPSGPAAMPAALPPTTAYTYAVEYSVDEAIAAGARAVRFSRPVITYLENFLGFPVGASVPSGFYDRERGAWVPQPNGRVIAVVGADAVGATLDVDGSAGASSAAALAALGITDAERAKLATLYAAGQGLWRVPVSHFSPHDFNPPAFPPPDAVVPSVDLPGDEIDPDDACREAGSIIACEHRALGERLPIQGTPFTLNYWSDRLAGSRSPMVVDVPVTGPTVPSSLLGVQVHGHAMGRLVSQFFQPAPDLRTTLQWDPVDRFGRPVSGAQHLTVTVTYVYPTYYWLPQGTDLVAFMARPGEMPGTPLVFRAGPGPTTSLSTTVERTLHAGRPGPRMQNLGGWTIDVHHQYDPEERVLYMGDGRRRSATGSRLSRLVERLPQWPPAGSQPFPSALAVGPDGSLFFSTGFNADVRRILPDGTVVVVAGTGIPGFSGDGGPATAAGFDRADDLALGPDGSIYVKDMYRIRRIDPGGVITTFAGNGVFADPGWGQPATASPIGTSAGLTVAADGSVYFSIKGGIARVAADGVLARAVTFSGPCTTARPPLTAPLSAACFTGANFLATGADGSLYVVDDHFYRRIGPDGTVRFLGGFPFFPGRSAPVGGPAIDAQITAGPLQIGRDGSVLFVDQGGIRRIRPDGILAAVEGVDLGTSPPDGQPALGATPLGSPFAVGPDGTVHASSRSGAAAIYRVTPPLPGVENTNLHVASEDGEQVYVFDAAGRHLRTVMALTGVTRFTFGYTSAGDLDSITDGDGNVTRILRTGTGAPTGIQAPFGQVTTLTVDGHGNLAAIADPAGNTTVLTSDANDLLASLTDPRGNVHLFGYDAQGRLVTDRDPAGGAKTLASPTLTATSQVTSVTTALGRVTSYGVTQLTSGDVRRTFVDPAGLSTVETASGLTTVSTAPDGAVTTVVSGADPRWGMQSPTAASTIITLPSGTTRTVTESRAVTFTDPSSLFALATWTRTVKLNGRAWTYRFDVATRTLTTTSPAGRVTTTVFDTLGRTASRQLPGVLPVQMTYDANGRTTQVSQGNRSWSTTYDALGRAASLTGPMGLTTLFSWDAADLLSAATRPDGQVTLVAHDASRSITSVTPPGRGTHALGRTPLDAIASYTPPSIAGAGATSYTWNVDRDLAAIGLPDSSAVTMSYDAGARVASLAQTRGTTAFSYAAGGQVASITAPDGGTIRYAWDGPLATQAIFGGAVVGTVLRSYDADLAVATETVNGVTAGFARDADGLVTGAGALALTRDAASGLVTGTELGMVRDATTYDGYGDVASRAASAGAISLLSLALTRDAAGRIAIRQETVGGVSHTYAYRYDAAGRLDQVTTDGAVSASYAYDANGNRTSATVGGVTSAATFDAQDRLVTSGGAAYGQDALGQLATRTEGASLTQYAYDAVGNTMAVVLPSGTRIDYVVDGWNRRIGKKVGGVLVQGFLYWDQLHPLAELDGGGALASRFVYASERGAPAYMTKGTSTYRILSDHLGSPRLVVDAGTGIVVQRLDYDEFGNVTLDTNPGFQPFGFAGGLYDRDTGLVRFGARDYDPANGRWTAKDPLRFDAGDTNLYAYALGDPVNFADPSGLGPCEAKEKKEVPRIPGTLPALIVDTHDPENLGRVKIHVPGMDAPDAWVKLPLVDRPGSGPDVPRDSPKYVPPSVIPLPVRVGDEVSVAFQNGDPYWPTFVNLMHSGK